jgi:hypothetical protein
MTSTRIRFTYPHHLLHTPLIYEMGKEFGVVTNIRRANIGDDQGWVEVELTGAPAAVRGAVEWARGKGVHIEEAALSGS